MLIAGLAAIAAVTLLGVGWILIGSRRKGREPATELMTATSSDLAVRAIPTVEARARRRARLRTSEDPIIASLGLSEPAGSSESLEGRLPRGTKRTKR
jgi:hypothetical protein